MKVFPTYNKAEIIRTRGVNLSPEEIKAIGRRNIEIANFKKSGWSWTQIAKHFDLSREYVKTIGHKLGARGIYKKTEPVKNQIPLL